MCTAKPEANPKQIRNHHALITAGPFFEKHCYVPVKEQQVMRHNAALTDFIIEKQIDTQTPLQIICFAGVFFALR